MSTEAKYEKGTEVRFLAERLGVVLTPDHHKFAGTVGADFTGTYEGPHPTVENGWHLVAVTPQAVDVAEWAADQAKTAEQLYVPVHVSQFEAVQS